MKVIKKIILIAIEIDVFLLEKIFQRISNFFQKVTGLTCFFLAKVSAIGTWSAMVVSIYSIPDINLWLRIFLMICSVFYLLIVWFLIDLWDRREKELAEKEGVRNPAAIIWFEVRVLSWLFLVLLFIATTRQRDSQWYISFLYLRISMAFVVLYAYFASCTPLPPCKSLIQKFIDLLLGQTPDLCPDEMPPKP